MADNEKSNDAKAEKNSLFREESLDVLSSPEDLDRYIKTTKPRVWVLLIAIIIFLVGVLVWAKYSTISSKAAVGVSVENGVAVFYINENDISRVSEKSTLKINDKEYQLVSSNGPKQVGFESDAYILHASNIPDDGWYYEFTANVDIADGQYEGSIIFEKISPISLIFSSNK